MLTIKNLHITLNAPEGIRPLIRGIDLIVSPRRPLTLMGETGCGKSLIAQAVFHLLPREMTATGEINYADQNLLDHSHREIRALWGREIFLFPQEPGSALDPLCRARSQVTEIFKWVTHGARTHLPLKQQRGRNGSAQKRTTSHAVNTQWKEGFCQVGLSIKDGKKYPWQLSGGMGQRLLTVMALAEPARLIVADEPTKGLDEKARNQAIAMLQTLTASDKGLFVITHDPEVPKQLGGDLAVMVGGMIMELGPSDAVLNHPRHPYTRALINALPQNGLHPIPLKVNGNSFQGGCPFSPRCTQAVSECFFQKPEPEVVRSFNADTQYRDDTPSRPFDPDAKTPNPSSPREIRHEQPTPSTPVPCRRIIRCHLGRQN